jgi:hypothetical protein
MFFVTHPCSTLHQWRRKTAVRGSRIQCPAKAKGMTAGRGGCAAGVSFAAENVRVRGMTGFFFSAISLLTLGGFLEQRGAWGRNEKLAPSKKGREAQYLNQPPLAPQGRVF